MKTGSKFGVGIVVAATVLSFARLASAQTWVWTNNQAGTQWWSTNANWIGNVAPGAGGSLTLGSPALDILLGFTPALNDTFMIVSGLSGFVPGVNGIFSGKADGSSFTVGATEFQIDYNPSDITLTVIPEPASLGLMGLLGIAGVLLRRRIWR